MDTLLVLGNLQVLNGDACDGLERAGLRVVEARNEDEGIALCRVKRPAIALIEVDAPDGDHLAFVSRLRRELKEDGRIVAICNAYSDALDDYCEELGADMALPQTLHEEGVPLFVRGLINLIPPKRAARQPAFG